MIRPLAALLLILSACTGARHRGPWGGRLQASAPPPEPATVANIRGDTPLPPTRPRYCPSPEARRLLGYACP